MSIFEKIENARKILQLGEDATIEEIRESYRQLSLKYHPDRCKEKNKEKCEEKIRELNEAMEVLLNYCVNYRISFRKEDIRKNITDYHQQHLDSFFDDWWGEIEK